jgi:hypothetical protein
MWTLGPLVLGTLVWLYCLYVGYALPRALDAQQRRSLWSLFGGHGACFWGWCVSVLVCSVAFLYFSVQIGFMADGYPSGSAPWVLYPYGFFLGFLALYAPLLVYATTHASHTRTPVVLVLIGMALSATGLFVWSLTYLSHAPALITLMAWLAFHCTALDAVLWAHFWYHGGYWTDEDEWVMPLNGPWHRPDEGRATPVR